MPGGVSGAMSFLFPETMSLGATSVISALRRCSADSASTTARPSSSSGASTRSPFFGPSLTVAGFEPVKVGEVAATRPLATAKCSDR